MTKFKKSPQARDFITGGKPAAGNLDTLTIRISPVTLERLRALAYFKRSTSQREIIEAALDKYFQKNAADLEKALKLWDQIER